jgi:hypothetical protein
MDGTMGWRRRFGLYVFIYIYGSLYLLDFSSRSLFPFHVRPFAKCRHLVHMSEWLALSINSLLYSFAYG